MKVRKKPVVVEAKQWFQGDSPLEGMVPNPDTSGDAAQFVVETLEGPLAVKSGAWIVTGVKGEKYPVDVDIFDILYEPAEVPSEFETYKHHDVWVWVHQTLKGRHREHCLCYKCKRFLPKDRKLTCLIASVLYAVCRAFGLVTPVWECPEFQEER